MKKIKVIFLVLCIPAFFLPAFAQEETQNPIKDSYDPLIPQLFAVDRKVNVFAAVNSIDNTIDLMRYNGKELERYSSYLVDVFVKRHDVQFIYRPKSVAIYQGYVVFLASHADSCYLAVLTQEGQLVKKLAFAGEANAFSFSHEAQELYISGETRTGYDIIALDASKGVDQINLSDAAAIHYRKPKMSEVIAEKDPWGIGISAVAMGVVFLSLLLLYLVFKQVGKSLVSIQNKKSSKHDSITEKPAGVPAGGTSGEVYAAISAAIHLYNEELHDEENTVLTINKVSRTYSPWSSKIHGLNTYFNRK